MDVFDLMATLGLDSSSYENGLQNALGAAKSIGGGIAKGFAVVSAGIGAASAGAAALSKQAVDAYANYEQLVGGMETLFQESSDTMLEQANRAYATAGMSANDYMETATAFSASLLNSLGGDTEKAAEYADKAIQAMSDNANKMGVDMEMIENAYRGFARGNFTMLDNLSLGFAGSKEGMEALLEKAHELNPDRIFSIDSYADIIDAIQTVQDDMGITGTTAKEAMFTISGAAAATSAAWENVIAAIGGGGDLGEAFDGLMSSLFGDGSTDENGVEGGLINRVIPQIQTAIDNLGTFLETAVPQLAEKIPPLFDSILPPLLDSASTLFTSFVEAIVSILPTIIDQLLPAATDAFNTVIGTLADSLPNLIDTIGKNLPAVITGLATALKTIITKLPSIISPLVKAIASNAPILLDAILEVITELASNLDEIIIPIVDALPDLLTGLGNAILENIEPLYAALLEAAVHIAEELPELLPELIEGVLLLINGLLEETPVIADMLLTVIPQIISPLIEGVIEAVVQNLPLIVDTVINFFTNYVPTAIKLMYGSLLIIVSGVYDGIKAALGEKLGGIWNTITTWWEQTKANIADGWNTFITAIKMWFNDLPYNLGYALADMIIKIGEWETSVWNWITTELPKIIEGIIEWFATLPGRIGEWFGEVLVKIATWATDMIDKVQEVLPDVIDGIAEFFEELPDKAIEWGKDMIQGFIDGVGDMADEAMGAIEDFAQGVADRIGFSEPEKGPLSNFHTYAPDMMELFAKGIMDNENIVANAMDKSLSFKPGINGSYASTMDGRYVAEQPTINLTLEVDGEAFGQLVYRLNGEQDQRVGVNMVEAFA